MSVLAWGQANVTGGALSGTVKDASGAVIGNAVVKVKNVETGLTRETTTGEDGTFRVPALAAGAYDITVTATGFTELTRRATVLIGQTAGVEITLSAGDISETVNVTADSASIVETARTQQSTTVNERAVKDLPVNGRNFLDFIRLTPGINVDPRAGDYSAGGLRGTFNSLLIDGADNNNTFFGQTLGRTGVRAPYQFSQSSVKEFQVNTNSYAAEFGRAGGALVNVITKSGTNEFHGEGFYFFRDNALNATDGFIRSLPPPRNRKPDLRVQQFGGSIGGPVRKDKLFFFFTYDGQRRNDPIVVAPLVPIPTSFSPAVPADVAQRTIAFLNAQTAPYQVGFNQDVYMGKVDWQINSDNRLSVRYNRQLFKGKNQENPGQIRSVSATGNSNSTTDTVTGQITTILTPNLINEGRFGFSRDQQLGTANSNSPETIINSPAGNTLVFGRNNFSPRETTERRFQVTNTLTYVRGRHTYKAGFDFIFNRIFNFFPGFFGGSYVFNSYEDFALRRPSGAGATAIVYQQAFAGPNTNGPRSYPNTSEYGWFVQDDWNITNRFKLYYGLRYDAQVKDEPPVLNDDPRLLALGVRTQGLKQDLNNFAPRVGFAWNILGDGKTVLRGGYGIFYARTPSIVTGTAHTQNGLSVRTLQFTQAQLATTGLTYPNTFASPPAGVTPPALQLFFFASGYVDPMVHQASLGIERELTRDLSLSVSYLFTRGIRLTRTRDINLRQPIPIPVNIVGGNPVIIPRYVIAPGSNVTARPTNLLPVPPPPSTNVSYGRLFQFENTGDSVYHALAVQATKRFSQNFQFLLAYTWSTAIDNRPDQTIVTAGGGDTSRLVADPLNIRTERGRADVDIPHRFVLSYVWELAYARNLQNRPARLLLDGFQFSGIVTATSGSPFSALAGGDLNGDGTPGNDRAPFIGRNTFRRKAFASFDLRLTRTIPITERYRVELIAEAFNLFNRFNQAAVQTNQFAFGTPGGVPTLTPRADFRAVNGPGVAPRVLQLAAKFVF
ncbi:MAG: TonB-dependent receptor [Chloracidobacterium sp.]|nr:TonB-dependent receptor [Chloracidobacterium sp.]MDW8216033.1 TonB-dependent receptor [Acidobacteriota bacterium]